MYPPALLPYHLQKCVILFRNDSDHHSYPKESSDYGREMQEGLVVVEGSPRLGWVMESPENGTRRTQRFNLFIHYK